MKVLLRGDNVTVQEINNTIDMSVENTNARNNRLAEIRNNRNNVDMQRRLEIFDSLCLNRDEKEQIRKLNKEEERAFRESKRNTRKMVWNGIKIATGNPYSVAFGAVGAMKGAYGYDRAEKNLIQINDTRDKIRRKAQDRYMAASKLTVNINDGESQKGEYGYEFGECR